MRNDPPAIPPVIDGLSALVSRCDPVLVVRHADETSS